MNGRSLELYENSLAHFCLPNYRLCIVNIPQSFLQSVLIKLSNNSTAEGYQQRSWNTDKDRATEYVIMGISNLLKWIRDFVINRD